MQNCNVETNTFCSINEMILHPWCGPLLNASVMLRRVSLAFLAKQRIELRLAIGFDTC